MRIAIVSDTHVGARTPAFLDNLDVVLAWFATQRPDRVMHLGDATLDGLTEPQAYELIHARLARLSRPLHVLPGNHDIGEDGPTAAQGREPAVTAAALAAWRRVFGPDYWSLEAPGWQVIGLNAQLFGGRDIEAFAQWSWLEGELSHSSAKLGVMLHKPLFRDDPAETERHQRYAPPELRAELWRRLRERDLRFVVAGHTHQLRRTMVDGVEVVWAPSAAYRIPDDLQEPIGRKTVGALWLELEAETHRFAYVEPLGLAQHDLADHPQAYPELARALRAAPA
jgi:3',5'-cyclic AMP phosphodiesterase CpdA